MYILIIKFTKVTFLVLFISISDVFDIKSQGQVDNYILPGQCCQICCQM